MFSFNILKKFAVTAALAVVLAASTAAQAGFTGGNLVVINTTSTGNTESIVLNEYNVSGSSPVLVNSYPISGVSLMAPADNDRQLKLSGNGELLTFAAYAVAPGLSTNPRAASSASAPRTIVSVNASGAANLITVASPAWDALEFSSVVTQDGSQFWGAGENLKTSTTDTTGGPRWISGDGSQTYCLYTGADDGMGTASVRGVGIYNNQLYYCSGSGSFGSSKGVSALGTDVTVPAADTHLARTILNGGASNSTNDFVAFDLTGDGYNDVLYAARKDGVAKFVLTNNGLTATYKGLLSITTAELRSITARTYTVNGTVEADIFAASALGDIYKVTDTDAAAGALSGSLTTGGVYLASDAGHMLGGLDFAPTPEPATMSLLALGGLALLRRRRA